MSAGQDFWSRRRARVEAEEARIAAEQKAATTAHAERKAEADLAELSEDEVLAKLGLPVPESVSSGEVLQKFMAQGVPSYLKRRAMRALWRSNPIFANLDGLIDYGDDYTDAANVIPDLKTAYQVGKGMLKHLEHVAARAEQIAESVEEDAELALADDAGMIGAYEAKVHMDAKLDAPEQVNQTEIQAEPVRTQRRMKFRVEGEEASV